jgi:hypothetical protein
VDWFLWKIITSKQFNVRCPSELETHWSFQDAIDAHDVLDAMAEADRELEQLLHPKKPGH